MMAEGVEIVIGPRQLREAVYILVIIALVVLLIIKWNGGSCAEKKTAETGLPAGAGLNQTAQTANATNATQGPNLCANGVKDQDETDVDCGGAKCDKCDEFKSCNVDTDCKTTYCHQHIKCLTPTCSDGIKNQDESNVDCGGKCGGFYYDNACHAEPKQILSNKVDLIISDVNTSVNPDTGFAKIESLTFKVTNGKAEEQLLTAYIFARDPSGKPYYESSTTGDEIPLKTIEIPAIETNGNYTETVVIGRTLTETDPVEHYRIVIDLRDSDDKLITETTWTNS
jgi:hypothetical protein